MTLANNIASHWSSMLTRCVRKTNSTPMSTSCLQQSVLVLVHCVGSQAVIRASAVIAAMPAKTVRKMRLTSTARAVTVMIGATTGAVGAALRATAGDNGPLFAASALMLADEWSQDHRMCRPVDVRIPCDAQAFRSSTYPGWRAGVAALGICSDSTLVGMLIKTCSVWTRRRAAISSRRIVQRPSTDWSRT